MANGQYVEPDHTDASVLMGLEDCWEADTDLFLDQLAYVVEQGKISFWKATGHFDLISGDIQKVRDIMKRTGVEL